VKSQMAVTADGTVYRTRNAYTLIRFDGSDYDIVNLPEIGNRDYRGLRSLAGAPDGTIWVTSTTALLHYDGQRWEQHPAPEGLFGLALAVAPDGSLWVDTLDEEERRFGLLHYTPPD
jgi:hypothetical protein